MAGHLSVAVRPFAAGALSEYLPSVSPDGQWVVFGEWPAPAGVGSRLMIRAVGAESARPLIPESDARSETTPNWSPDGQAVIYQRIDEEGCQLRWFAPFSGDHREVAKCHSGFVDWIDFTPDGSGLLLSRSAESGEAPRLRVLDLASGQWRDLDYPRSAGDTDVQGVYSPDGRWLAFRRGAMPISDLYLMPAEGGPVRRLTELRSTIRGMDWLPDSRHLVYASSHGGQMALWLLDTRSGQSSPLGAYGATFPQVARLTGALVYQQQLQPYNLVRLSLVEGVAAEPQPVFLSARADAFPSLSPDGRQLAFVSDRAGRNEIMLGELGSGDVVNLTRTAEGALSGPAWSPDGRNLLYSRLLAGGGELVEMDVASRRLRTLPLDVLDPRNGRYSADGLSIYFDAEVDGVRQIFRVGREDGAAEQLSEHGGRRPIPAPDGRYLYLLSADFGLQRLDLQEARMVTMEGSIGFASQFGWDVDERGVHVLRSRGEQLGWGIQHWPAEADPAEPPQWQPIKVESELMVTLLGLSIGRSGEYYTTAELNADVDVMYVDGLDRLLETGAGG
jgi:Tol biopolymer transport system component